MEKEIKTLKQNNCKLFIKDNNQLREKVNKNNKWKQIETKSDILLNGNDKLLNLITNMNSALS